MQAAKALRNEKAKKRRDRNRFETKVENAKKQSLKNKSIKLLQNFAPYLVILLVMAGIFLTSQYGSTITGFATGANNTNNAPEWQGRTTFTVETSQTRIINLSEYVYDEDGNDLIYKIKKDSGIDAKLQENSIIIDGQKSSPGEHEIIITANDGSIAIEQKLSLIVLQSIEEVKNKKAETEVETELLTKEEVKTIIILKKNVTANNALAKERDRQNRENVKSQLTKKGVLQTGNYDVGEINELTNSAVIIAKITKQGLAKLEQNNLIESIFIDRKLTIGLLDSVPLINATNLTSAGINLTGKGQTACIIDTGIDNNHEAFAGRIIDEKCFCSVTDYGSGGCCANNASTQDIAEDDSITSHGTHVAGIIASNGTIKGVASESNIVVVKACDNTGQCAASDIMQAIDYCNDKKSAFNISVISGSFGDGQEHNSTNCPTYIDTALNTSNTLGISTTFSAGNEYFTKGINYPACSPFTIAVGASTKQDTIADFSNKGETLSVLASGAQIQSTIISGYGTKSGTSMSTAHVAGGILLIKERDEIENKSHTPEIVKNALKLGGMNISEWPRIDIGKTISIIDYVTAENTTFNGTNESIVNETFHIAGGAAPAITLNAPGNASITARLYQELNITATDPESDVMNISIYGDNISTTPTELLAFYQNANNITTVYNWTAPTAWTIYRNDPNLAAYFNFNKLMNATAVNDSVVNLNGTLIGNNVNVNTTQGVFGGALEINISSSYVQVPSNNAYNFSATNNFTVATWIYPKSITLGSIAGKWDGGSTGGRQWRFNTGSGANDGKLQLSVNGGSGASISNAFSTNAITANKWQHVAVTWNQGAYAFYINGVQNGTGTTSVVALNATSPRVLCIGVANNANANTCATNVQPLNGSIDDLVLFNRSLSTTEISALYSLGNSTYYWNTQTTDGLSTTQSTTNQFTIQGRAPYAPILNTPANATISALTYRDMNITVSDPDGNLMNVSIYADNISTTPTELVAFYQNVVNNSELTYNLTSPTISTLFRNDNNLVSYWKLDNVSLNGTQTFDWTGRNNGTLNIGVTLNTTFGKLAGSHKWNGNAKIILGTPASLEPSQNFTITAWVYPISLNNQSRIFGADNGGSTFNGYYVRMLDQKLQFGLSTSGGRIGVTDAIGDVIPLNTWSHVAVVYNSTTALMYNNGILNSTQAITGNVVYTSVVDIRIGARSDTNFFNGSIDEVAFFNRSLSSAEITSLYSLGNSTYNWKADAYDYANLTATSSSTNKFIVGTDTIKPLVNDVRPTLSSVFNTSQIIEIAANATDDFALDTVWANITLPNASITSITLTATGIGDKFNNTYTIPSLAGLYNITFYANDTSNNLNNSIKTNFTATAPGGGGNNPPTTPVLTDPTNGNITATNRTPILRWTASTDADSDPIMYNITLECTGTCTPYAQYIKANTTLLNFTVNQSLQVDTVYKWNVTADDFVGGSNTSLTFNFTVASLISATLTNNKVDFGALAINVSSDTTSNNPLPLRIRNDGNVYIDVNLTGDNSPWSTVALGNVNFQTKAGGGGTINSSTSLSTFTNIAATTLRVIGQLNFSPDSTGNTSAEIELNITVPESEPAGYKEANMTITAAQTT